MATPPTDWPSLRRVLEPRALEETQSELTTSLDRARRTLENPFGNIAGAFVATDTLMTRATVLLGPDATRPVFQAWSDLFLEAVVKEGGATEDRRRSPVARIGLAGYVNLVRCTGGALRPELADERLEASLLPWVLGNLRKLDDFERQTLALSLLALSDPSDALAALKRKSAPRFAPNAVFGADAPGLMAYLVSAVATGASPDSVRAAWLDALAWFPRGLATRTTSWARLSWLARIIYGRIGGVPLASIADCLIADILSVENGYSNSNLPHAG